MMQFIPARYLELAWSNRPMVVRSYEAETQQPERTGSAIEELLLTLLTPERQALRGLK
jgi:hypothetical protein